MAAKTASRGASNRWLPWMFMGCDGPRRADRRGRGRGPGGPGRPPQRLLDVVQVGRHRPRGGIGIGRSERDQDGLVIAERPLPRRPSGAGAFPADLAERVDDPHELGEEEVAGRLAHGVVELDVQGAEPVGVGHGAAQLGEERLQVRDLGLRDPLRGQPDVADLHDAPGLDHLGQRDRVLGEDEVQVGDQLLGLQGRDVGAGALADLDHVHDRERTEGLPEDGPADMHHGGQLALGGELVPGPQALRPDQVEQAGRDLVRQGAPVDDGELGPGRARVVHGRRGRVRPVGHHRCARLPCCCHRRDARPI